MTPRAGTMRLACMFSSILLFGAAGLLLFISLQDPTELSPRQVPGEPLRSAPPPTCPSFPVHSAGLHGCLGAQSVLKVPGRQRRGPGLLLAGISLWPLASSLWSLLLK